MQHPLETGAHCYRPDGHADQRSHRYRSFMIEEILTDHPDHRVPGPAGDLLKFGVQALLSARPCRNNHLVLKADQTNFLKFPVPSLSNSPGAPLGSALLSGDAAPQVGSTSHRLPLDLRLGAKLDPGGQAVCKTKKVRRNRTVFSEAQLMRLEKRFERQKYLSTPDSTDLAGSLGLSHFQVKTWYQNRRMKWKKIVLQGGGLQSPTKPKGRPRKHSVPGSAQLPRLEGTADAASLSDAHCVHQHLPC